MDDNNDSAQHKDESSITKRSLMAIRRLGSSTSILRKHDSEQLAGEVTLREITKENFWAICNLSVSSAQEDYVANNVVSIAEAYVSKTAWLRGIYIGETPVGFLMLSKDIFNQKYVLWRFMIDSKYQKKGYGRRAFKKLIEEMKAFPGANELTTSYVSGRGGPKEFLLKMEFIHNGKKNGEEHCLSYYLKQ